MLREINMENKIASIPLSRKKKSHLFSFLLTREGKFNFKEMENFKECQNGIFPCISALWHILYMYLSRC